MSGDARIVDRGYRRYTGPRLGVGAAMRTVALASIQRSLGLRRSIWAKLPAAITAVIAFLPALVFVGLVLLLPADTAESLLPEYPDYYGFITTAIIVFTALIAPTILTFDRRAGLLGLYLASPLDRDTYLLAKFAALGAVLTIVTMGPPLLMLLAFTLQNVGPDGLGDWTATFGRIVVSGLVIAILHAALGLAVAAFTDRPAIASTIIGGLILGSRAAVEAAIHAGGVDPRLHVFDLAGLPFELVYRIWSGEGVWTASEIGTPTLVAAYLAWSAAGLVAVRWRYARLAVRR